MLSELTDCEAIRRYLRALRREQLLARVQRDEDRVERLLLAQTIAVDAADCYSADAAPLDYMLSLLDRPELRDRVSSISIDLSRLDDEDRNLLERVLTRADAICRLRSLSAVS
jgi:hypothetical protein